MHPLVKIGSSLLPTKVNNFLGSTYAGFMTKFEKTDAKGRIVRLRLDRIRQDVTTWRDGIKEAENPYNPFRVRMQQTYIDTVLNGHVQACLLKRKNLTLLKDFQICNKSGVVNEKATEVLQSRWFYDLLSYTWDAIPYGYSYINWTDVIDGKICGIQLIQREFVNPDRELLSKFPYGISGVPFNDEEMKNWMLYVGTPSENGMSNCGYGLLYKVALYEIYIRNLLGYNGDFVELFAQPFRHGKTTKTEESERAEFEKALRDMGSSGYAITDPTDTIEFLNENAGGTGYKAYESMQKRCEDIISKVILGHASALDPTPGKLGNDTEPARESLEEIETLDNRFIEHIINDSLLPKLNELGVIKTNAEEYFKFLNNKEEFEKKDKAIDLSKKFADVVKTLSDSGYEIDPVWIEKNTDIPIQKKIVSPNTGLSEETKSVLNRLYAK